jgi:hypothetical protein
MEAVMKKKTAELEEGSKNDEQRRIMARRVSFHEKDSDGDTNTTGLPQTLVDAAIAAKAINKLRRKRSEGGSGSKLRSTSFSGGHDAYAKRKEEDYQKRQEESKEKLRVKLRQRLMQLGAEQVFSMFDVDAGTV